MQPHWTTRRYRALPSCSPPSPTFVAYPSPPSPRRGPPTSRSRRLVVQAGATGALLLILRIVFWLGDWELALSDDAQAFKDRLVRGARGFRAAWTGPERGGFDDLDDPLVDRAGTSISLPSVAPIAHHSLIPPAAVFPVSGPAPAPAPVPAPAPIPAPALAAVPAVQEGPVRRRPDYFRGEWRLDRFSAFDVDRFSQFSYQLCGVSDLFDASGRPVPETEEGRRERETKRAQEVARWVWVPERRSGDAEGRLRRRDRDARARSSAHAKRQVEGEQELPWKQVAASKRGWRDWTGLEMIEYLLKTDMGLLLVGDSLTGQMLSGLLAKIFISRPVAPDSPPIPLLIHPDPSTERSWPVPIPFPADDPLSTSHPVPSASGDDDDEPAPLFRNDARHTFMLFLNPSARDAFFPHVDDARLARPVVAMIRADFLVHDAEVASIVKDAYGLEMRAREGEGERHPEAWREWIRMWLGPPDGEGLTGRGKRRSVVVFNTGAHWTLRGTMTGGVGTDEEEGATLQLVSEKVADRVVDFLHGYRRRVHLVYRTSSPGHPGCSDASGQSVPSWARDSSLVEKEAEHGPGPGRWAWSTLGWERFKSPDAVWRAKVEALGTDPADGWLVDMMEVRQQALARGDAHLSPSGGDCLHVSVALRALVHRALTLGTEWCAPSLPPQWAEGLGHLVLDPLPRDGSGPWYTSSA